MLMSKIVTMTSTVGDLTSGQTFRVRSKEAERLLAQSKCTVGTVRGAKSGVLSTKEGKKGL